MTGVQTCALPIFGIAAVIPMLAIGQGSKASIKANIAEMGSNMIMISPGADMRGGVRQDASSMETLKQADYQSIKDECNYISAISPTVNSSGQWIYGNNNTQSSIYGVNQDYLSIRQLKVAEAMLGIGAGVLNAQTVKGTVISGTDNEPLIGASVMVQGTKIGAVTDLDGNFAIEAKNGQTDRKSVV